ncbi:MULTISPECIES: hypothetical protein [unclassified Pseudonocardia]|uniref:hypothetical protein n=1 Tax=unclassified Pseudonocardia TaxID=2619320 RepID=UPI0001FFDBF4|nr:hypothetical protein [Pseudonocardia sp. Ae707_Ps1]
MSTPLEHEWEPVSRHRTSDGVVSYLRCRCGSWRIHMAAQEAASATSGTVAEPVPGRRVAS